MNIPTPLLDAPHAGAAPPSSRCILILMHLAPELTAAAVADVFRRSRDRHHGKGIHGTMLFDGERLGALMCGTAVRVEQALAAVFADAAQTAPRVLVDAADLPPWLAPAWRAGWSEPDALALLAAAQAPAGTQALELWRRVADASDLL